MSNPGAPTVAFTTLGCRLNQAESDSMAEQMAGAGVGPPACGVDPDIVIVNTCTVTREATKASRSALRRAAGAHPDAKVVAIGCYAVSDPDEVASIEGVDVVLGNDDKERVAEILGNRAQTAPLLQIAPPARRSTGQAVRVRANLKAQTGCDEWCTFCIIPKTRGPLRSLDADLLVEEGRRRIEAGARELVLTGVHLGKYGYDLGGDERSLIRLWRRLLEIDGVKRLRLSSILSRHLTKEVVGFIASEPRMCRYLHVPLQSGSDAVLGSMHRPYRIADYVASLERARDLLPDVALATDIIVGFPGETEQDFSATMDIVRRLAFSKLHVFRYSARPDTAAAGMDDGVHPEVKRERSRRLIALGNQIRSAWLGAHLGRRLDVLVEDEREIEGVWICSGQTDDHVRVFFEGRTLYGSMVQVEATEIRADGLKGHLPAEAARR
ncbi:MAG: tRNA (N(6)-L-threonylcarbamoyladenosine(37)-C(2))-methylthiotransferase MtaB [Actinomycetota bacterium]|nr:tRNA (N(6)-L-threonylcarbamoyladenosine(37)-C(2))-methylthiotransferase MtaB [Actinomycetota bacterium]